MLQENLLEAAARDEGEVFQAKEEAYRRGKAPSRWSDDAWDNVRRVAFISINFIATMLSSSLVCSWITDGIGALRQRRDSQQFSIDAAIMSFNTYGVVYSMCMDDAIRDSLMQVAQQWKAEQDKFKYALKTSEAAMNTLTLYTSECKDELRRVQATFQASKGNLQCTTDAELAELETLNNAWSIRQPAIESWLFLELQQSNSTRNSSPAAEDQVETNIENHKARIVQSLNATNLAIQRVVASGSTEVNLRLSRVQQIATSLQDSLTFPSAATGQPIQMNQALKSTQESIRGIRTMWTALEPALEMSGAKQVSPMSMLGEADANLVQLIQVEQSLSGKLHELQESVNDTQVNIQQWQEAVMAYTTDTSATLDALAGAVLNQSKGDLYAYSNWTIRTALLQQQQRLIGPVFPNLEMANLTNSSSTANDFLPKSHGLDIQLEGMAFALPVDLIGRVVLAIFLGIAVWRKSYVNVPQLDNQGITTIRTKADWVDVFRCRHNVCSIIYSLSTINLMPLLWTMLIMFVCFGATFGFLIPINRTHTMVCTNHANGGKSSGGLGGLLVSLVAKQFQSNGDLQAIEGFGQLQSIHDRTCTSYELQMDKMNIAARANASALLDDYSDLHAVVKQFRQCLLPLTTTNDSNASTIAACGLKPEVLRGMSAVSNWTCPRSNLTLASVKAPCVTTLTQDFKDTEGKVHGCGLERLILESVVMWWVWLILFGTLNFMRGILMEAVAITLWRALSGGRMPFVGFVGDDGTVLDQCQLSFRFERQLDEYLWLRKYYGACAGLVFGCGMIIVVATLGSLP
ncbi:hypothetical protein AaE_012787 [Aphanomyces astaci]|uniref:Uncharacterized protein n=1 Tax=Aphanomyces astaci TaxID=112090 RepID=A0A6A4ZLH1_APHAT|nr:hypothetical protein AaE_012787 [Aphanomyces astaci]